MSVRYGLYVTLESPMTQDELDEKLAAEGLVKAESDRSGFPYARHAAEQGGAYWPHITAYDGKTAVASMSFNYQWWPDWYISAIKNLFTGCTYAITNGNGELAEEGTITPNAQ